MNLTVAISPLVLYYPPTEAWQERYRSCSDGLCLPCPYDGPEFGTHFQDLESGYPILAVFAVASVLFLFSCYAVLPKEVSRKNAYTIGIGSSYITLSLAYLLSFNLDQQKKTTCFDSITRAVGPHLSRCAISGMLVVYGYTASRLWLCLWIFKMHMQIVWQKNLNSRPWITILPAISIPLILAAASIPYLEYTIGPVCLPRLGLPIQMLLEVPVTITDGCALLIQCLTFGYILHMLAKTPHTRTPDASRAVYNPIRFLKRMSDSPLASTWHLLARPMIYSSLSLVDTILFASAFFHIGNPWTSNGQPVAQWLPTRLRWLQCLTTHQSDTNFCSSINGSLFNRPLMVAAWYYWLVMCLVFTAICVRWEMLTAMKDLICSPLSQVTQPRPAEFSIEVATSSNTTPKDAAIISAKTEYVPDWPDLVSDDRITATTKRSFSTQLSSGQDEVLYEKTLAPPLAKEPSGRLNLARAESELNAYLDIVNCGDRHVSNNSEISVVSRVDQETTTATALEIRNADWSIGDSLPWSTESTIARPPSRGHRPQLGTVGCPRTRYSNDSGVRPFYDM